MCDCDYGIVEFYTRKNPKAKKIHQCNECCSWILPGQHYEYETGKYDGEFYTNKTCHHCSEVIEKAGKLDCFCYELNGLYDNLYEIEEELKEVNISSVPACRLKDRDNPRFKLFQKNNMEDKAWIHYYHAS